MSPSSSFQSRVFAAYQALHAALSGKVESAQPSSAETAGALAGAFIVSDSLSGVAEALPLAAAITGACYLGMDNNVTLVREMLRQGKCDFVVNSLSEGLRILKNELRQKKPVSICLAGEVKQNMQEMADRGVAPDLLLTGERSAAAEQIQRTGALLSSVTSLLELAKQDAEEVAWTIPHGTAAMLARLDAIALQAMENADRMPRRWLEAAQRYLPRETPPSRVALLNGEELRIFLDEVSARLMSGEITPPVEVQAGKRVIALRPEKLV